MKKSCILFACTILTEQRTFVLYEFLKVIKDKFYDCDLYIGINPGSIKDVENIIIDSGIKVVAMSRVSDILYTESDASAYQISLKLLKESKRDYDTCWFIHTKGAVNSHSDYLRSWYIKNFLNRKDAIENILNNNPVIGSYGMLSVEYDNNKHYIEKDVEIPLFENKITEDLPYTHSNFFYIHTLYAIKGDIINKFLSLITDKWYDSNLGRYYFEGVFPFIVSRLGYFLYVENKITMNGFDIVDLTEKWAVTNNLTSKMSEINLYLTNYKFDQLTPPNYNYI